MPLTYKQRHICVSGHTAGPGSLLPGSSEGQNGEEEGGTKQASSLTAFETVVPFIPDFANCQWPCSFSGCGPRLLLELTKSSILIQRDQGENTQRNRPAPPEGAARFALISGALRVSELTLPSSITLPPGLSLL